MSRFQRRVISLAGAFGLASVFLAGCTIEPIAGPVLPYGPSPIGAEYYGDYGDYGDFGGFGDGYFVGPFGYGGRRYAGFHGNHAWHRAAGVRSIPSIPGGGFRGGVRRAGGFRGGGGRPHAGGGIRR